MNSKTQQPELAEPYILGFLSSVGLDVAYKRASGNTLYYEGPDGREVEVFDAAGGYGSLFFGHNNPEIVAHAKELLDWGTPVLAQFSRHPDADAVAGQLNRVLQRELGTDEPYFAIFGNSGAEAIEAAVKHAELDRVMRVGELTESVAAQLAEARAAVLTGEAVVAAEAFRDLGVEAAAGATGFEALAAEAERRNAEAAGRAPVFLTLEGSFHGKLVGSVQLTHNPGYRTPFTALAAQARFVPREDAEALRRTLAEERTVLHGLAVRGGQVVVVEHAFPSVAALLLEPIQGEGGIVPLSEAFVAEIQRECAAAGVPIVVDEIQSGVGRTGRMLASSAIGLHADYYVLAKSLGGGLAKTSVMLTRQSRYRHEFELVHSSTFAKDGFSTRIALKVLQMLEADGGRAYRLAEERGARLAEALGKVRADFPDVVKDVRGRGLMQGLEFHEQSGSASEVIAEGARSGLLGYHLAGFLLREHRVRTFPTASAGNTLRFAPSVLVTDAEIDQLEAGLRAVAEVLRDADEARLTGR
ncbi:aminotransferase class III-fold pyridoxal phosphate-dependent enzyme [Streptomyces sp. NPDC051771]|uniref:aspartate aminotransferase family protein n=1 Tax=Streptomyces sp. NPDC051771 TaxID=3154847 RepID=UPI003439903C